MGNKEETLKKGLASGKGDPPKVPPAPKQMTPKEKSTK
jgi:hypothetical protein